MVATTARKDFPVFDCDSHVVEPPSVWDEYVPAKSRAWIKTQFYPHHEAEDAWDGLHHMAEFNVPAKAQQKLMGENARRLYGIEPLMAVKERIEKYEPAILPW